MHGLQRVRQDLTDHVRAAGRSGDAHLILATEQAFVDGDLDRYANSSGMISSLAAAQVEIDAVMTLLPVVEAPERYRKEIDAAFRLPKNRRGGVPNDEARQALRSHTARLMNLDKSRLTSEEKAILEARRASLVLAEKLYARLQVEALEAGSPEMSAADPSAVPTVDPPGMPTVEPPAA
jgi:hypothetical protein